MGAEIDGGKFGRMFRGQVIAKGRQAGCGSRYHRLTWPRKMPGKDPLLDCDLPSRHLAVSTAQRGSGHERSAGAVNRQALHAPRALLHVASGSAVDQCDRRWLDRPVLRHHPLHPPVLYPQAQGRAVRLDARGLWRVYPGLRDQPCDGDPDHLAALLLADGAGQGDHRDCLGDYRHPAGPAGAGSPEDPQPAAIGQGQRRVARGTGRTGHHRTPGRHGGDRDQCAAQRGQCAQ
ncbi:hypothetical protein D3C78_1305430 [compost metagenome]